MYTTCRRRLSSSDGSTAATSARSSHFPSSDDEKNIIDNVKPATLTTDSPLNWKSDTSSTRTTFHTKNSIKTTVFPNHSQQQALPDNLPNYSYQHSTDGKMLRSTVRRSNEKLVVTLPNRCGMLKSGNCAGIFRGLTRDLASYKCGSLCSTVNRLPFDLVASASDPPFRGGSIVSCIVNRTAGPAAMAAQFGNLSIHRQDVLKQWKHIIMKEIQTSKRERRRYLRNLSVRIDKQTDCIITAKRKREQTFYDLRRKPPLDKYDPELIAQNALTDDGVLLRQIKDFNYYQRQAMYKECILRGLQAPVFISVNRNKQKGRSVYAAYRIEEGEFVLEYCGDLIDKNELELREKERNIFFGPASLFCSFIFSFKVNGKIWYIDATSEYRQFGAGRLVNHSHLNPNLGVNSVSIDGQPRLFFYAKREIQPKEELLVDYGEQDPTVLNCPRFAWLRES